MTDMSSGHAATMQGRPSFWSEMFTFRGRTNRGRYWLTVLVLGLIWSAALLVGGLLAGGDRFMEVLGVISLIALPLFFPAIFAAIRRLHDRDKSGHWLWLFYLLPGLLNGIGDAMRQGGGDGAALIFALPSFAISIWGFVEIGCLRGTPGPNRFGPDPLAGLSA